ncbi:MAG: roadblock/LC7 domain-containing protein [bacterium]|nr:roadblock/LC7 domain-containing protein [bacterium]
MSIERIKLVLQTRLEELVNEGGQVEAALAVTTDGHMVASAQRKEYSLKRLAAMGSTLMSLGDTITKELQMGSCKNIISENEDGIVVFMHITKNLVMVSLTSSRGGLGLLLSSSRNCIGSIIQDIKNQNTV